MRSEDKKLLNRNLALIITILLGHLLLTEFTVQARPIAAALISSLI
jgi:hypothetical protein